MKWYNLLKGFFKSTRRSHVVQNSINSVVFYQTTDMQGKFYDLNFNTHLLDFHKSINEIDLKIGRGMILKILNELEIEIMEPFEGINNDGYYWANRSAMFINRNRLSKHKATFINLDMGEDLHYHNTEYLEVWTPTLDGTWTPLTDD